MSLNIGNAYVIADGTVGPAAGDTVDAVIANGTVVVPTAYVWAHAFPWMAIGLEALLLTTATQASQTVVLQASDTASSFSSPTTLATLTISSADAAFAKYQTFVAASAADLDPRQILRVAHVATATDTARYIFRVIVTPNHF